MFPANDAPTYRKTHGYIAALVFVVALTLWCSVVLGGIERWYYKRQVQSVAEENGSEEASVEETEVQQKSSAREAVSEVS